MNNRVFNLHHYVLFFFICGTLFSCTPKPQADCGFVQNVYGQRISWKDKLPIEVEIDPSVPHTLKPAIYRAAKTWEMIAGRQVFAFIENRKKNTGPGKDKKNGIYFLLNWDSNNRAEQGRTSVYWVGDEIQEADIRINGSQFAFYDQDPKKLVFSKDKSSPHWMLLKENSDLGKSNERADFSSTSLALPEFGYNFEALVLHELGHFLGLKHKDYAPSVMETYLAANTNRVQLGELDKKNFRCEYKD